MHGNETSKKHCSEEYLRRCPAWQDWSNNPITSAKESTWMPHRKPLNPAVHRCYPTILKLRSSLDDKTTPLHRSLLGFSPSSLAARRSRADSARELDAVLWSLRLLTPSALLTVQIRRHAGATSPLNAIVKRTNSPSRTRKSFKLLIGSCSPWVLDIAVSPMKHR